MIKKINWFFLISILLFLVCLDASDIKARKGGASMKITSTAFQHNTMIPAKYTYEGMDINPPLLIENIPEKTKSIVLIVDDPDAPGGTWIHWIVFNIPYTGKSLEVKENSIPGIQG